MSNRINEINNENYAYELWEREQKNLILAMRNVERKQKAWHKVFPTFTSDDNWMLKAKVF